jgi:diguanylate cyclase (GGDEF)-like protein
VAEMAILADLSQQVEEAHYAMLLSGTVSIVSGAALFTFFYWLVGRIGTRIERDELLLEDLASRDALTGLLNKRMFNALLEDEAARTARYQRSMALLLLDIDHFKRANDTYGHVAGDEILKELGGLLLRQVRQQDRVCRYGGEEMAAILIEVGQEEAAALAERLRAAVEETTFKTTSGQEIRITVSIGVAILPRDAAMPHGLVTAADAALYVAKRAGRNCVRCHENPDAASANATLPGPNSP